MATHELSLTTEAFAAISSEKKTIEPRLCDDKCRKIKVGDEIVFVDRGRPWRTLHAQVTDLLRYDSFSDLFKSTEAGRFGKDSVEELIEQVNEFYSEDDQKKAGVIGIEFEVLVSGEIEKHSAGGVIIKDSKVLTISWTTHDYVCFPKGGLDEGETSEEAALREVYEETGYRVKIVAPIGSWTYRYIQNEELYKKTADYYLMELIDNKTPPTPQREPGEYFENLWLDIDEAKTRLTLDDSREVLGKAVGLYEGGQRGWL